MQNTYKYTGQSLTTKMAKELITERFAGHTPIEFKELRKRVDKLHRDNGGQEYAGRTHHPVRSALTQLRKEGVVKQISLGLWQIGTQPSSPEAESDERDENNSVAPKTIGPGDGEVYVYYFPAYQRVATDEGKSNFECKIGKTEDDSNRRAYSQIGTGMPEEPRIGLIIKTDDPSDIERRIHSLLKAVGRHKEDAPGTEWFFTNPDEVERIFNSL